MRLHFCSLLLLYCIVFVSSFLTTDALACLPDQIQALIQFKNEFESDGCNRSDYLNGVQCDNTTGAVTKLQLPSGCFTGTLKPNSSLFELHQLRYLNLSHNNFTSSSLPSEFSNLTRLEVLSLASSSFTGQVPSSISNLILLTHLNLSHNELTGSFPPVRNLTKLSFLDLSYNQFSGAIPFDLLPTLPFLSYLDLKKNHLTGSIDVPNSSSSSKLVRLSLGFNQFEGKIIEPISKLINLNHLELASLNISHPIDLRVFAPLKSLLVFDIRQNRLLPASLSSDSEFPLSLISLILIQCDIIEFPNIFKTLQNLEHIDISNNLIKGKVPEWFWKLPRLSIANLVNNSLTGFEGSSEVLLNSSVQLLDFAYNSMTGAFPTPPLGSIYLSAWNNSFTGNIPLSICNRSSLIVLDLSYNKFTGRGAKTQTLDVGYNRLTGKLPKSLLNCSSLRFLSVDNNRIEDTFPFWLKALPNLHVLTLRSNRFFGHLSPPDRGPLAFPELRILELSDNSFTGSLPPNFFVNFYSTIDFSGNKLEGQIPESIGLLKELIALNLSNNAFTGHIPMSLANVTELESLDLSRNQLSGNIPRELGSLSFLAYISVAHNQLKGEIPQGPQFSGQAESSFEGNVGLCGLPLQGSCVAPPTKYPKEEDEEEEEDEVIEWKAVFFGYWPGLLLGLVMAHVIASFKPKWFVKILGPAKGKQVDPVRLFMNLM